MSKTFKISLYISSYYNPLFTLNKEYLSTKENKTIILFKKLLALRYFLNILESYIYKTSKDFLLELY